MALRVATWNVEGRLDRRSKHHGLRPQILNCIQRLDADLVVLPEAHYGQPDPLINERLTQWGYTWQDVAYRSNATKDKTTTLRVATRLPLANIHTVRFGNIRSLLCLRVVDPETQCQVRIITVHLDARSEERRLRQIDDLVAHVACEPLRTVVLGDFNAVWPEGYAAILGSGPVRTLAHRLPIRRLRAACVRLTDMAIGTTLTRLATEAGLQEADRLHVPTAMPVGHLSGLLPNVRLAQLDHILLTPGLVATDFDIADSGGSSHRAISAKVHVRAKPMEH